MQRNDISLQKEVLKKKLTEFRTTQDESFTKKALAAAESSNPEDIQNAFNICSQEMTAFGEKIQPLFDAINNAQSAEELDKVSTDINNIISVTKKKNELKEQLAQLEQKIQSDFAEATSLTSNQITPAVLEKAKEVLILFIDKSNRASEALDQASTMETLDTIEIQLHDLTKPITVEEIAASLIKDMQSVDTTVTRDSNFTFEYSNGTLTTNIAAVKQDLENLFQKATADAIANEVQPNQTTSVIPTSAQINELLMGVLNDEADVDVTASINNFIDKYLLFIASASGAATGAGMGLIFGPFGSLAGGLLGGALGGTIVLAKQAIEKHQADKKSDHISDSNETVAIKSAISEQALKLLGAYLNQALNLLPSSDTLMLLDKLESLQKLQKEMSSVSEKIDTKISALSTPEAAQSYTKNFFTGAELRYDSNISVTDGDHIEEMSKERDQKIDNYPERLAILQKEFDEIPHEVLISTQEEIDLNNQEAMDIEITNIIKNIDSLHGHLSKLTDIKNSAKILKEEASKISSAKDFAQEIQTHFHENVFSNAFFSKEKNTLVELQTTINNLAAQQNEQNATVNKPITTGNFNLRIAERLYQIAFSNLPQNEIVHKVKEIKQVLVNANGLLAKARLLQEQKLNSSADQNNQSSVHEIQSKINGADTSRSNPAAVVISNKITRGLVLPKDFATSDNLLETIEEEIAAVNDELEKQRRSLSDLFSKRNAFAVAEEHAREEAKKILSHVFSNDDTRPKLLSTEIRSLGKYVYSPEFLDIFYNRFESEAIECIKANDLKNDNEAIDHLVPIFQNCQRLAIILNDCLRYEKRFLGKVNIKEASYNSMTSLSEHLAEVNSFTINEKGELKNEVKALHKLAVNRLFINEIRLNDSADKTLEKMRRYAEYPIYAAVYKANRDIEGEHIVSSIINFARTAINLVRKASRTVAKALGLSLFTPKGVGVKRRLDQTLFSEESNAAKKSKLGISSDNLAEAQNENVTEVSASQPATSSLEPEKVEVRRVKIKKKPNPNSVFKAKVVTGGAPTFDLGHTPKLGRSPSQDH